jgi:glycerol-3-phosphate dehydrogenase
LFLQRSVTSLAAWYNKEKKKSTAAISRNHVIEINPTSGLVSLMGGKWTAYRIQGEETVDRILKTTPDL